MNKRLAVLLVAVLLILSGCTSSPSQSQEAATQKPNIQGTQVGVESLSLYPVAATMPIARELKLKATVSPAGASVTWASSNEAVATVDANGKVTTKAPGECVISISADGKSAECAVLVEEECRTVIFAAKPIKGDGDTPPEPQKDGSEENIPIELPPEITDVDKIPQTDEFIWTLEFDETFATLITIDDIPLIVDVTISFVAEKRGGQTGIGSYTGTFGGDADLDREHFLKVMNENSEIKASGGKLTDYTENDEGLQDAPITVNVVLMDDAAYHEVTVGHIPVADRTVTQQLPIPISDLFPGSMMALGEVGGMVTISGTMTMKVMGQSITMPFGATESSTQPFTICIYPSGDAVLTFPLMEQSGFARNWVAGMLTKRPLM